VLLTTYPLISFKYFNLLNGTEYLLDVGLACIVLYSH